MGHQLGATNTVSNPVSPTDSQDPMRYHHSLAKPHPSMRPPFLLFQTLTEFYHGPLGEILSIQSL